MNYGPIPNQLQAATRRYDEPVSVKTPADCPMSTLQERAAHLAQEFEQLEQVIVVLWDKLQPFLKESRPPMEEKLCKSDEPHSRMWQELNQAAARVCHNRIVLAQLLERIEV